MKEDAAIDDLNIVRVIKEQIMKTSYKPWTEVLETRCKSGAY